MTENHSPIAIVIPAYQPNQKLVELVHELARAPYSLLVLVNDGSEQAKRRYFDEARAIDPERVQVLEHAVNLGKGQALKTAFNWILTHAPGITGVVTADADGQHLPEDIRKVAQAHLSQTKALWLGSRAFNQEDVPLRSEIGNRLTRFVFELLVGARLTDTQTGLRALPKDLLPHLLRLKSNRYDFELEMLIEARKRQVPIRERAIATVYHDRNQGSHFNPLIDSLTIYFVFLRFVSLSLVTILVDWLFFALFFQMTGIVLVSIAVARLAAGIFNFTIAKRLVFHSHAKPKSEAVRYAALVVGLLVCGYGLMSALVAVAGVSVYWAKLLSEGLLFFASFAIQRIFVFQDPSDAENETPPANTDWDAYYDRPAAAAGFTRRITERKLIRLIQNHARCTESIIELGGGNSCFFQGFKKALQPKSYAIVDTNRKSLELFRRQESTGCAVQAFEKNVLEIGERDLPASDVVISVGLIEHFSRADTARAIRSHFQGVGPEGLVVLTFPTPTWLYRLIRGFAERLGLWKFLDERPLRFEEVIPEVSKYGEVLHASINWPIGLTQGIVAASKRAISEA